MKKSFGIKDIAKMLGISVSTVSRALRDAYDVNPETKKRVLELTEKLNFKLNKNASALASGNTKNIGVVIPFITNYYFSTVISGIQEEAYNQGYNIILYVTNDDIEREKKLIENIATSSLDGLLISISSNSHIVEHFETMMRSGLPIVFFDRVPQQIQASKVVQSDFDGAYQATTYLIEKGYDRIAHIAGPSELSFTQERLRGYLQAHTDAKVAHHKEYVIFSGFGQSHGFDDTKVLLSLPQPPNAIFAVNDRKAVGAIQALNQACIRVGQDFGVIGFTNDPISTVIEPNLTTIEEPAFEIGRQSCQLLIRHIKNKDFEPREILIPGRLIERQSVRSD
ncbi:LacI family DNA-binding transcriptional regulator [Sphingobacterium paucimobilis]|nr:LacI family DNA-binding transcriptional regulator [Sphingobacterium paucimobilis]